MLFYILIIIIFALLFYLEYVIFFSQNAKIINKIPGPKLFPIFGNTFLIFTDPVRIFYTIRAVLNRYNNEGYITRVWMLTQSIVNIYHPDDIEILLTSNHIEKGYVYKFLHRWFKEGLLTSKGEKWQERRKILTPTFHFSILRQFCDIFIKQSDIMVEKLKLKLNEDIDVQAYVTEFTLNTICETAMGLNLETNDTAINNYKKSVYDMGEIIISRINKPWLYPELIYYNSTYGKREVKTLSTLLQFTSRVIKEKRFLREKSNINKNVDINKKERKVMLDLLLDAESENKINDNGIREEVDTFMFEGHDTTTVALTYLIMLLANHPEIQEKIVNEIDTIFGDSKEVPTMEDYNKLTYLEMCIKESLRLYPSVPIILRHLKEDLQLKNYLVPAGASIVVYIYDIHRNAKYFPDPDKFIPERFTFENSKNRHPFSYIPFSAGKRNCIGKRFALLEEKVLITAILKNFKLIAVTKPEDLIFSTDLLLRTKNNVKVKFILRNNN